jgi:hypothetical protein
LSVPTSVTTPLTNAIEKTPIVTTEIEEDEVEFQSSRRFSWKSMWRGMIKRVSKAWCPADREWTLTSIQVTIDFKTFYWFEKRLAL